MERIVVVVGGSVIEAIELEAIGDPVTSGDAAAELLLRIRAALALARRERPGGRRRARG